MTSHGSTSSDYQNGQSHSTSARKSTKICQICGDKASGYNFSVLTCQSCKSFFRRHANHKKSFYCPSQDKCTITVESRKFCPKCRLRKCFEVGMRLDFMMTQEELVHKRRRLLQRKVVTGNRTSGQHSPDQQEIGIPENGSSTDSIGERRTNQGGAGNDGMNNLNIPGEQNGHGLIAEEIEIENDQCPQHDPPATEMSVTIRLPRSTFFDIILSQGNPTDQLSALRRAMLSSMAPNSVPSGQQSPVTQNDGQLGTVMDGGSVMGPSTMDDQACMPGQDPSPNPIYSDLPANDQFTPPSLPSEDNPNQMDMLVMTPNIDMDPFDCRSPSPLLDYTYFDLRHTGLMNELVMGNVEWKRSVGERPHCSPTHMTQDDYFSMAYSILRAIIKQYSHLKTFTNLSWHDQHALMKAGARDLIILRASWMADVMNGHVHIQSQYHEATLVDWCPTMGNGNKCKEARRDPGTTCEHCRDSNWVSVSDIWRANQTLMLITSAILLFNPDQPGVVHKETVKEQREIYCQLLKDYLDSTYSLPQSRPAYSFIIAEIGRIGQYLVQSMACPQVNFDLTPQITDPMFVQFSGFSENDHLSLLFFTNPKTTIHCFLKWSTFSALRALLNIDHEN